MKMTHAVPPIFAALAALAMNINASPRRRVLYTLLLGIAALWIMPEISRAQLYVSQINGTVGEYNATTGAVINVNFITGLGYYPDALSLSGSKLFVATTNNNVVAKYDATTGALINANFITTGLNWPDGLALSGNNLFVASAYGGTVGKYDATTGAVINANFITELNGPVGLVLSGNNLFVTNGYGSTVGE